MEEVVEELRTIRGCLEEIMLMRWRLVEEEIETGGGEKVEWRVTEGEGKERRSEIEWKKEKKGSITGEEKDDKKKGERRRKVRDKREEGR